MSRPEDEEAELARPWPERPVSEANKSGKDNAASRGGCTCPHVN